MRPAYMCQYCNFIGSADDVHAHESMCALNPNIRGCLTCNHYKNRNSNLLWICTETAKIITDVTAISECMCREWKNSEIK